MMYYVNWLRIFVCVLLFGNMHCHPSKSNCNRHSVDCGSEYESAMHPKVRSKRGTIDSPGMINEYYDESSSIYWQNRAQNTLERHLDRERNLNTAKNIIFFLGDGMSIPTLTAARIYLGQNRGQSGEEARLSFEHFPHVGLSKTYCIDKQVPDSACTSTAYLCGVKANFQTIGVNGHVQLDDCMAANHTANQVNSLLTLAQRAGKKTGIITTTTVTHASPAGNYAHTPNRMFECDSDIVQYAGNDTNFGDCQDIASQLVFNNPGQHINVIFGGGRTKFLPKTLKDVEDFEGERRDGLNLIEEWSKDKTNAKVIFDRNDLINLNVKETEYVLGLFAPGHMDFNLEANEKQPKLIEMVESAIQILQNNNNGFYLFVEGGRIDHGHHFAQAIKALDETVELSNAIKRAIELTNRDDTLIVVTSDHAHTMSIAGYPDRGNPIQSINTIVSDIDNLPTLTLSYANGPGYNTSRLANGTRVDLSGLEIDSNFTYPGTYPSRYETHGGDDVAVFAIGCMSHLFSGVYEQNTIPHLINYASCMGDGLTACNQYN